MKQRNGPTDAQIPMEKNWPLGRQIYTLHGEASPSYEINEMPVRLQVHRVFNQLRELTAERRWVSSRLRSEMDAVGVACEDYVRPTRPRTQAAPSGATPLQSRKVDGAPGRHRCSLAPRRAVLAAIEGQQLAARLPEQPL